MSWLLSDHDKDCLSCTRNQHCELQELGNTLGINETRFDRRAFGVLHRQDSLNNDGTCRSAFLCRRCVTVCNEIQQTTGILNAQNRGFQTIIGTAFDLPIGTPELYVLRAVHGRLPGRRS